MGEITKRAKLAQSAGQHFGGERDLYEVLGYPRHVEVNAMAALYNRQDIAARVVDAYPDATWREEPHVKGTPEFVEAFQQLCKTARLWRMFHRLDRVTGLGHYGVLFLGLDGGEQPHLPATGNDYNLLYLQPHSERTAQITRWEDDPSSPRYGKPLMYRLTTGVNWTGAGAGQKTLNVHHSRVVHVAERPMEDESIGTPRLEGVFNRLMDLDKLLGGSAEMYWQNVAMLLAFMADSEAEFEPEDKAEMEQQIEEMQHGLRRSLRLRGMTAQQLAPGLQGSDPTGQIDKQIEVIGGTKGIPKRLLTGSERGELASSQDENNWAGRVAERREQFAGPSIVEEFIKKGATLGFLPTGFKEVFWDEQDTLGEEVRANIADRKASALQRYAATPGSELIVSPEEFRSWLGEEADLQMPEETEDDELDDQVVMQFRNTKRAVRNV